MKNRTVTRYIITTLGGERERVDAISVKKDGEYFHFFLPGGGARTFRRNSLQMIEEKGEVKE